MDEDTIYRYFKKLIDILDYECCLYKFTREEVDQIEEWIKYKEDSK